MIKAHMPPVGAGSKPVPTALPTKPAPMVILARTRRTANVPVGAHGRAPLLLPGTTGKHSCGADVAFLQVCRACHTLFKLAFSPWHRPSPTLAEDQQPQSIQHHNNCTSLVTNHTQRQWHPHSQCCQHQHHDHRQRKYDILPDNALGLAA